MIETDQVELEESIAADSLPAKRYATILADPPWNFRTFNGKRAVPSRTAADPYTTMTREGLLAMPVADLAEPDAVLLMWTVDSHLDQGMRLGEAWGFKYKTIGFIWRKLTKAGDRAGMGMGYWSRKQAEVCLLFTRGKPSRKSKSVRQIIDAPRREHSRKPDAQYERIESLVRGPYLELFSRTDREGWDSWGNDTGRFKL